MKKLFLFLRLSLLLFSALPFAGKSLFAQCNTCVHINGPVSTLCDSTKLNWATWTSVTATTGSGTISSTLTVSVTKPTGGMSTTPVIFSGGLFPPQYGVPVSTTAIRNDLAGLFTFCYSTPVRDPQIALASIGAPGIPVQVNTSECYDIIWPGQGMSYPSNTSFIGTEGYTIIKFPGIHSCISFDYLNSETYCNLAFGILDTNCQRVPTVICAGSPVTLNAVGGTSPYTWSPATGLNTTTGMTVVATPTVTTKYFITDGNCTDSLVVNVNPAPAITNISSSSIGCANPYGIASVSTFGGTPAYTYNWSPGGCTTQTATGLSAGNYVVTVSDSNNCSVTTNVSVTVTAPPAVTATSSQATCGNGNGTATANPTGGTPGYNYLWSNGQTTASISNLAPGNYTVTISDNSCNMSNVELASNGDFSAGNLSFSSGYTVCSTAGCLVPEGYYGIGPDPFFFHPSWYACQDHTTGTGDFMIVNGAGTPGTNVWCQTVAVAPNTNYTFSTWVTSLYPVSPAQLQFYINGIPLGGVFSAPGTPCSWQQFFSVWNSGANTSANICVVNQNNILSGNDFGLDDISFQSCTPCVVTATVAVTQPALLTTTISQTNPLCSGNSTGSATVNPITGTPSYTYNWSSGQSTSAISGIPAGNYSVTITDATGCTSTQTATITQPTLLNTSTSQTPILCNGGTSTAAVAAAGGSPSYTYLWNPAVASTATATGLSGGNYSVTVSDANGCTSAKTITITQPTTLTSSTSQSTILCNGGTANASVSSAGGTPAYTYNWSNGQTTSALGGIAAGNYSVTITDANGCTNTHTLSITQPSALLLSNSCSDSICQGDSALLSVSSSGGTPNYTYAWLPVSAGGPSISVSPTSSSVYSVTVTDANGCVSAVQICSVAVLPVPKALFDTASGGMFASTYSFTDLGNGGTSWYWIFGDGNTSTLQNPVHTFPGAGTYTVTQIVYNQFGCPDTFRIVLDFEPGIIIPNVFTPDGDGINDVWYIPNSGLSAFHVDIYDRWGLKVFESTADQIRWDGHSSAGKLLSDGTYYYVLTAVLKSFQGDKDYSTKGHVTLLTQKRK